jgi:TPR repeat protein
MKRVLALLVLAFMLTANFAVAADLAEITELKQKAEAGHVESQVKLAVHYRFGTSADLSESAIWWRAAAEQGNVSAQFNLAEYLRKGRGITKDVYEAIEWYTKAAESGHLLSQYDLANLFLMDTEIPQNPSLAFKWISAAAAQGSAEAQNQLGWFYWRGYGVPKDAVEAIEWYTKAAAQNHYPAQAALGRVYLAGEGGVAKNLVEAHVWFNLATASGFDMSGERSTAEKQMTLEQIAEATKLARERFEKFGPKN